MTMLLIIILGIINIVISSIGTYAFGLPGFDLTLIGVIIAAHSGENPLLAAIILSAAYALPSPGRFMWIWVQVLIAWLVGWLAITFDMVYLPIFLFHVLATAWVSLIGAFTGRHVMHTFINLGMSLFIARFWIMMS